MVLREH